MVRRRPESFDTASFDEIMGVETIGNSCCHIGNISDSRSSSTDRSGLPRTIRKVRKVCRTIVESALDSALLEMYDLRYDVFKIKIEAA